MLSEQELNALAKIAGVSFTFTKPVSIRGLQVWEAVIYRTDEPRDVICLSLYKPSKLEAMNNAWDNFMNKRVLSDL